MRTTSDPFKGIDGPTITGIKTTAPEPEPRLAAGRALSAGEFTCDAPARIVTRRGAVSHGTVSVLVWWAGDCALTVQDTASPTRLTVFLRPDHASAIADALRACQTAPVRS